jgi:general stress protein 26
MNEPMTRNEQIEKLRELIKDIDFCMLTTADQDGTLRSRPMSTQQTEFDGDLWFFTEFNTAKVEEVQRDQHVNVSYSDPKKNCYVSVSGTAQVMRDQAKINELWNPVHRAWFPKGPEDPNLALLKVKVTQAEYWDDTSSSMVQFFKMVKAAVTGVPYEAENKKLNL